MARAPDTAGYEAFLETVAQVLLKQDGLCRNVLETLDEEPRRWSELKPLLEGRRDESLNMCLRFLQEESLIERRTDAREEPVVHRYELSPLGEEILSFIEEHSRAPEGYALVSPSGEVYRLFEKTVPAEGGGERRVLFLSSRRSPEGKPVKRLTEPLHVDPQDLEKGDSDILVSA
jgi:DNA-binding HxlR family transcriptional regulator